MARKAILEGGKRDEIIAAAQQLFFSEGYEQTSVRKVLDKVGGEVGMFYHYFKSKEELFNVAVDRFFRQYAEDFEKIMDTVSAPEDLVDKLLKQYEGAMQSFGKVSGQLHWSMASALHERTLLAMAPAVQKALQAHGYDGPYPLDIAAGKLIADVSAALHAPSFAGMTKKEKKAILISLIRETWK